MKNINFIFALLFLSPLVSFEQQVKHTYNLTDIIDIAKSNSLANKIAQSKKENSSFGFSDYKASLKPQLLLTGNPLNYNKDFFGVYQPDGTLIFLPRTQNYSSVQMGLTQNIGITGGTFSFNSVVTRFDDLVGHTKQYNGIPFNIQLAQPIGGFNAFKWQKKTEPLKLQESEKEYRASMEDISHQTCLYYFDVLDAQESLELATKNLQSQSLIYDIELKRVDLGTTSKEKVLQLRVAILNLQQDLKKAQVQLKSSQYALKTYIGLQDSLGAQLQIPNETPEIKLTINEALDYAKKNRAEYVSYRRRKIEAERDLEQAKKQNFSVNLTGALGFNNIGNTFYDIYQNPHQQQSASIGVQIPVLDWGRRREKQKLALSNLKTVEYSIEQEEQALNSQIINLIQNLELIKSNISTAKLASEISLERFELSQEQIRLGKLSVTDLNISLKEKDEAKRAYITSLRSFWDSYFQLRTLTLFDDKL